MSGDEKTAGSERVTNAADLHDVLGLPHPSSPSGALEPIPVTAATFASSLRPAFALGAISYRVQIGAVRLHKRVAFLETHVLGEGGGQALGAHANAVARDSDVPAERRTLTQLVVDAAVIGEDRFEETRGLCLGDVLDVDARWIWDPKRAHPLNLAVSRFRVVTRWDEEPIVALRKGGFHKVREHKRAEPETGPDPGDRAGGCGLGGTGGCVTSGGPGAGSRGLKVRGVIKTRRVQDPAASRASETEGGGEESSADAREAHGSWEGAKDRARKMCAWILEKVGGAAALRGARGAEVEEGEEGGGVVLDVAGGAGYLAMELCKVGVPVTLVDPRPPRSFNRCVHIATCSIHACIGLYSRCYLSTYVYACVLVRVRVRACACVICVCVCVCVCARARARARVYGAGRSASGQESARRRCQSI